MKHLGLLLLAVVLWCQLATMSCDESSESEASLQGVVRGINTFSKELYQKVKSEPGNLVVSPFSVAAAVSMLLLGLRGSTETEVSEALHMPAVRTQVAQGFKSLFQTLQNSENVTLEIANKIYLSKDFTIKRDYLQETENYFQSVAEVADMRRDPEGVESNVNQWASDKTHGKIKNLLPPGTVKPDTVLILLNAIYFKGLWATTFQKEETRDEVFHLTLRSEKNVPMMHITQQLRYANLPEHNLQVLSLPYQGGKHSMLILLPNSIDGLEQLESNLHNLEPVDLARNTQYKKVIVTLPRFKILNTIGLNEPLNQLGMNSLFNGFGNFSGITDDRLKVSKALQKAFIEVNEEGTEAAAVTAILVVGVTSVNIAPPPPPIIFTADRPFMYMIVDDERGTVLFMGRVVDPAAPTDE